MAESEPRIRFEVWTTDVLDGRPGFFRANECVGFIREDTALIDALFAWMPRARSTGNPVWFVEPGTAQSPNPDDVIDIWPNWTSVAPYELVMRYSRYDANLRAARVTEFVEIARSLREMFNTLIAHGVRPAGDEAAVLIAKAVIALEVAIQQAAMPR